MQVQVQRVRAAWATMPRRAQYAVMGVAVATLFMLFFVLRASTSTEWATVTESGMTADKIGEAQTVLEEGGFEVRESEAGGALEVPKETSAKASAALIAGGIAAKGNNTTCAEMFGEKGSMGFSDTSKTTNVKLETCQEGPTANVLEAIDGIEKASVDVTMADTSLFTEEAQPAKASVALVTNGAQLSAKTVQGIQLSVSNRFEGLKPAAVSIIDETGASISKTAEDEQGDNQSKKLEIESKYNALTEAKLTAQFEKIVGDGNVAVISNAELDLDKIERKVAEYAAPEGGEPIVLLEDYEKELLKGAGETGIRLDGLTAISAMVAEATGVPVQPNRAIVGRNAFTHSSGIHQDGILKAAENYQFVAPELVGKQGHDFVLTARSGRNAVIHVAKSRGHVVAESDRDRLYTEFVRFADTVHGAVDGSDLDALVARALVGCRV